MKLPGLPEEVYNELLATRKLIDAAEAYIALRDELGAKYHFGKAHASPEGKALNAAVKELQRAREALYNPKL